MKQVALGGMELELFDHRVVRDGLLLAFRRLGRITEIELEDHVVAMMDIASLSSCVSMEMALDVVPLP